MRRWTISARSSRPASCSPKSRCRPKMSPGWRISPQRSPVPIASGERLVGRREFAPSIAARAFHIAQPDICHTGGLLEAKKIAALAETAGIGLAPHNPLGPLAGVAALHFGISTPNVIIQEEMSGAVAWYDDVVTWPIQRSPGRWDVPELPGLGVTVNEDVIAGAPVQAGDPACPQRGDARRHRGRLVIAMAGRLEGKIAIVTGAGQGIGAATARAFAAQGRDRRGRREERGHRRGDGRRRCARPGAGRAVRRNRRHRQGGRGRPGRPDDRGSWRRRHPRQQCRCQRLLRAARHAGRGMGALPEARPRGGVDLRQGGAARRCWRRARGRSST